MSTAENPCRLSVFLAHDAPRGVVLRRGPSAWAQLTLWQRDRDTFTHGQWLRGRVYERRCDLSPNGELFVYFAAKQSARQRATDIGEAWTAISRPPYFSALGLWPNLGTWYGGGVFKTDRDVELDTACSLEPHADHRPQRLRITHVAAATAPWEQRLLRDGWQLVERGFDPRTHRRVGAREIWRKAHPTRPLALCREIEDADFRRYGGWFAEIFWLETDDELIPLDGVSWAEWDSWDRLALVRAGALYAATVADGAVQETLLCDFNPLHPEEIVSPDWAKRW